MASREEVANKQPAQESEASPAPVPRTPEETEVLDALLAIPGMTRARLELLAEAAQVPKDRRATLGELRAMLTIAQRPTLRTHQLARQGHGRMEGAVRIRTRHRPGMACQA